VGGLRHLQEHRLPGLVASLALVYYAIVVLAVFRIIPAVIEVLGEEVVMNGPQPPEPSTLIPLSFPKPLLPVVPTAPLRIVGPGPRRPTAAWRSRRR
jgi:hypothetical protein